MHISDIINKWYAEYTSVDCLSSKEYDELMALLHIIVPDLDENNVIDINRTLLDAGVKLETKQDIASLCVNPNTERLDQLRNRQLTGEQGTSQWLNARHMYITASISAACVGLMGPVARDNQLLEKASFGDYCPFKGGYYTQKGHLFEDVTSAYYSFINGKQIFSFGLIPHDNPEYSFLGASTDGVTEDLINIEIKTLVGRQLDNTSVKKEYYHQMQQQMECLGLDATDFIEVKYREYATIILAESSESTGTKDITGKYGVVLEYWSTAKNQLEYLYAPIGLKVDQYRQWELDNISDITNKNSDRIYIRSVYWRMTDYLCRRINRDPNWIKMMGPKLMKFWNEVTNLRNNAQELKNKIHAKDSKRAIFGECLV
jgi:putative phage-type endonuclease